MAAMSVNEEVGHGTIKAPATHDPETDAQVLRKAMKGLGGWWEGEGKRQNGEALVVGGRGEETEWGSSGIETEARCNALDPEEVGS